MINLYSKVKLNSSIYKGKGLNSGSEGYIIEDFEDGKYYVEFSNSLGETKALLVLTSLEFEIID